MLAKKYRLPSSVVFRNAKVFGEKEFMVKVKKNDLPYPRYGFIIGKTVDKRATVRNRYKRLVRSCIEEKWINAIKGYDILFILKLSIKDLVRSMLKEKIDNTMVQIIQ